MGRHLRDRTALPFELWREGGVIHLHLLRDAHLDVHLVKELLRVMDAVDPSGRAPVLVEHEDRVLLDPEARALLCRSCKHPSRPLAWLVRDRADILEGEMHARSFRPHFHMRTFTWREEALRWVSGWLRSPDLYVVR